MISGARSFYQSDDRSLVKHVACRCVYHHTFCAQSDYFRTSKLNAFDLHAARRYFSRKYLPHLNTLSISCQQFYFPPMYYFNRINQCIFLSKRYAAKSKENWIRQKQSTMTLFDSWSRAKISDSYSRTLDLFISIIFSCCSSYDENARKSKRVWVNGWFACLIPQLHRGKRGLGCFWYTSRRTVLRNEITCLVHI